MTVRTTVTVRLKRAVVDELRAHRTHARQPLHDVIHCLLEAWKANHDAHGTMLRAGSPALELVLENAAVSADEDWDVQD